MGSEQYVVLYSARGKTHVYTTVYDDHDGRPDWPERLTLALNHLAPAVRVVRLSTERLGFGTTKTDLTLRAVRAVGAEPLLLVANWQGPAGEVRRWVDRYSIRLVEAGNETFYNYPGKSTTLSLAKQNARSYALQVEQIHHALQGTGCQLLVQADFPHWAGAEVTEINAIVPNFADLVDGVTIHPYENATSRIRSMYAHLASLGIRPDIPVWVTEYGIATADGLRLDDNYDLPVDLTYDRAAALVAPSVAALRDEILNLACLVWYQDIDQRDMSAVRDARARAASADEQVAAGGRDALAALARREYWFGACERDGRPKGAFTAAIKALGL